MSAGSKGGKVKVVVPVFLARGQDCAKIQVNWHSSWVFDQTLITFDRMIFVNAEIIR